MISELMNVQSGKKIAAYVRVSTAKQAELGYGLDVQEEKIKQYLKLFDLPETRVQWFIDEGISAKNLERKEMKKMLRLIKRGEIEKVIVFKLDRLTRSVVDTYNLLQLFVDNDCTLVAVMDNIDIGTANGRMFVGLLALISQWERETISERTAATMREIAFQGKYPYGSVGYGYYRDKQNFLYFKEDEQKVLMNLIDHLVETGCLKETVKYFDQNRIGGRRWKYQTVSKMFNNPFYRGHLHNNKFMIFDHHPAMFDEKIYSTIKKSLNRNQLSSAPLKHLYIFHGRVYCDKCGEYCKQAGTTKNNGTRYNYYRCPKCGQGINETVLIDEVKLAFLTDYYKEQEQKFSIEFQEQLKEIGKKKDLILTQFIVTDSNAELIQKALDKINDEEKKLKQKIEQLIAEANADYNRLNKREKLLFFAQIYARINADLQKKTVVSLKKSKEIP